MCRENIFSRAGVTLAVFAALVAFAPCANAQRTMRNQWHAAADFRHDFAISSGYTYGFGVSFGQYITDFYWQAGVSRTSRPGVSHLGVYLLEGGASYRLFSLRSHILNLYVGGNVFFGYDFGDNPDAGPVTEVEVDVTGKTGTGINFTDLINGNQASDLYPSGFCYGIAPKLEAEFFFLKQVALIAGLKASLNALTYKESSSASATYSYAAAAASLVSTTKTAVTLMPSWYAGLRFNF